jgi:cytochrome b pre-mRNA-processing protein 3
MAPWHTRAPAAAAAAALYTAIVARARDPSFYARRGVSDTTDGRFDMIALHAFLVLRRLKREQAPAGLAQTLFDHMFADMDRNLREMGVGDLSVGRRVKEMASAFYGRVAAYDAALAGPAGDDDAALCDAIARNIYRKSAPGPDDLALMAGYVRRAAAALDAVPGAALARGDVDFGDPIG